MFGDKCSVLFVNESFIFFHKYLRRILGSLGCCHFCEAKTDFSTPGNEEGIMKTKPIILGGIC